MFHLLIHLHEFGKSDLLQKSLKLCLVYSDTLSALDVIGNVTCVEVKAELASVIRKGAGIDKLIHPIAVALHLRNKEGPYEVKFNSVVAFKKHNGGMALALFLIYAVLKTDIAVLELIYLYTAAAEVEIAYVFIGADYRLGA